MKTLETPTVYVQHTVASSDGLPTNFVFVASLRKPDDSIVDVAKVSFSLEVAPYADHNGVASAQDLRNALEVFSERLAKSHPLFAVQARRSAEWFAGGLV